MIVIFGALPVELRGLADRLEDARTTHTKPVLVIRGRLEGREVALVRTEVGRAAAERTAAWTKANLAPTHVLSVGFAGGLAEGLAAGTIASAGEVLTVDGDPHDARDDAHVQRLSLSQELAGRAAEIAAELGLPVADGPSVTVDMAVGTPEAKAALARITGAVSVEMESHASLAPFAEAGIPVAVVRMVSDGSDDALPDFLRKPMGRAEATARILAWGAVRPQAFLALARAHGRHARAYRGLEEVVVRLVAEL